MSSLLSHPVSFFVEYSSYICSSLKLKHLKMKSLFISAMVMLSATTASAFDYVVTGNAAPEMEGKMFYLLDDNSNLVDSTKVAAGKFKFQGNADKA